MKVIERIGKACGYIGGIAICALLVIMAADVISRRLLGRPIGGATEMAQLSMVFIFVATPLTTLMNRHIKVDTMMDLLSEKLQLVIDVIISLLTIGILALLGWRTFIMSFMSKKLNVTYSILRIPEYPMMWIAAATFFIVAMVLVALMIKRIKTGVTK